MFPTGSKKKGCSFETPEPSSPKVTCIGQVRVKTKKQGKKMRSRSKRQGEVSFRKTEQAPDGQQQQECLPNRNQRWVHLPLSICEALRTFGAEFNCFLPCGGRSSCSSNGGAEREKGEKTATTTPAPSATSSCGAVFARWLMALQESEEEKRELVERVVGLVGDQEAEAQREKTEDAKIGEKEEIEEEEVSICIPPRNALLLMRCRSDPLRMSSFASRFWESPVRREEEEDEEVDEEEEAEGEEGVVEVEVKEDGGEGVVEVEVKEDEEEGEGSLIEIDVKEAAAAAAEEEDEKRQEILEKPVSPQEHEYPVEEESPSQKHEIPEKEAAVEEHRIPEKEEAVEDHKSPEDDEEEEEVDEEEEEEEELKEEYQSSQKDKAEDAHGEREQHKEEEEMVVQVSSTLVLEEMEFVQDRSKEKEAAEEQIQLPNEEEEEEEEKTKERRLSCSTDSFHQEEIGKEEDLEEESEAKAPKPEPEPEQLGFDEQEKSTVENETREQIPAAAAAAAAEEKSTKRAAEIEIGVGRRKEEENEKEEERKKKKRGGEGAAIQLPDCLLLMMCEPKLSMEVSKETWVCSTDFLRCRPSKPSNDHLLLLPPHHQQQQQLHQKKGANEAAIEERRRVSTDSNPAAHQTISMATVVEQKLGNAAAYEPFVLTRCKSEPMRSSAKLAPDLACFWKSRKQQQLPHAHVGVGAAGIGF